MKAKQNTLPKVVSALTARTQLGQILRRVKSSKERFLISKNGEPQAVVMGIDDYIAVAPAPDWLKGIWAEAKKNGTDELAMPEIDREIAKARSAASRRQATKATRVKVGSELARFGKNLNRSATSAVSEPAFEAVWANPEDDAYDAI